jgi:hypothetical protein
MDADRHAAIERAKREETRAKKSFDVCFFTYFDASVFLKRLLRPDEEVEEPRAETLREIAARLTEEGVE